MRIIQLEKQFKWAGQTQQTFHTARELLRRGHDVLLVCQPGSAVAVKAQAEGIPTLCLPMAGWRLYPSVFRLARELRERPWDVLHAHGARDHLMAVIARAFSRRVPLVRTKHNLAPIRGAALYRRFASRLIAVSRAVKDVLIECGVEPNKVSLVYDGIDLARFSPRAKDPAIIKELGLGPDDFVIGTTGRLGSKSKGIPTLLRAAQFVCAKTSRAKFLLVGRNSERVRVRADSCGLGQRVILPGFRNDVPALLSVMDVYVQPSLREAVSCSILEAMACGKPVLATRVGGIPEAVADGETGRLFQLGDTEGMAEAILELMSQPATLEQMGRNSRARVEKVFGLERMIDEVVDVYRSALRRS